MSKVEELTIEEWRDWWYQPQTKECLKMLDNFRLEMLQSIMVAPSGSGRDEVVGVVRGIQGCIDLIHNFKEAKSG